MKNRLASIDMLRGAAALGVVLVHMNRGSDTSLRRWLETMPLEAGAFGVHLFIVLSGFCIHNAVAARAARTGVMSVSWRSFWVRRFWRLYPAYWAAIAFSLFVYYVIGLQLDPARRITSLPFDLASHALMVHNLTDYAFRLGDGPLWTLGIEEQLYALYAIYLLLRRVTSLRNTLLAVAGVSLGFQCATFGRAEPSLPWAHTHIYWRGWPLFWWLLWVGGAVLAEARVGLIKLPAWVSSARVMAISTGVGFVTAAPVLGRLAASNWLTARLGCNWLWRFGVLSDPAVGLAAFILVNRALKWDFRGTAAGWLRSLGVFSYSLYLIHVPIKFAFDRWFGASAAPAFVLLRFAVVIPLCIVLARGFFELFERPMLNRRDRVAVLETAA